MSQTQKVDVFICGSGTAGLCAATWLARYGVSCKIVDQRAEPMKVGQADGVQCRTVEVFDSFGIAEELLRESYHVLEVAFWSPEEGEGEKGIVRKSKTGDTEKGLSRMPHVILNQARINGLMLEAMRKFNAQEVDYGYLVKNVEVDSASAGDPDAYPVTVTTERNGKEEVFQAKYALVNFPAQTQMWTLDLPHNRAAMAHTVPYAAPLDTKWSATAPTRSGA